MINTFNCDKQILVSCLQENKSIKISGTRPALIVNTKTYFIMSAFTVTYHNLHDMTLQKAILVLNKRKAEYIRVLNHENVYIGLSRVVQTNDIRLYPNDFDAADNLFITKP